MHRIIAGYTCAPAGREAELAYYRTLGTTPDATGVALAWRDDGTPDRIGELLDVLPADWAVALTAIAATYPAWLADHTFGLASPVPAGRAAALAAARRIAEGVRRINDRAGRRAVLAVEFHSAPGYGGPLAGCPQALRASLAELAALDWDGAAVLLEHCDAAVPGQPPVKGFLTLDQELAVLAELAGSGLGLSLNWGRSLIELRDPDRVAEHAARAAASGLLRGYTFSGNGDRANAYGGAWDDTHLPFADPVDGAYGEPGSLLTTARAEQTLAHLGGLLFLAAKTCWRPDRTDPVERARAAQANFATVVDLAARTHHPCEPVESPCR
ncbi:DUF4862 family protein [Kitasatospora sp. NPDC058965]|uniref:DUF4862 family protein n=1 Tax=Kitasatospora sp. NPDC058965 TaxID=3346682 RepID=UPI0036AC7C32